MAGHECGAAGAAATTSDGAAGPGGAVGHQGAGRDAHAAVSRVELAVAELGTPDGPCTTDTHSAL